MLTLLRRLLSVGTEAAPEENFFISSGLEFYGDLVARASSGRIEGKFDGHIIECRKLIIGPHATIKGNVFAEEIVVYGYCEGNLYAAGDMKVFDTAVILGDIHASSLIVEHNATFRGNLRKLRTEDFLEITAREKEKIIQQRKSNVYNIHSLNARLEAEQRRARKVANGMPLTPETEERSNAPLKRIQVAAPIIVQNDILSPTAVASGSEMPRAINIQASPVDVSTLTGGMADFLVPAMNEAFLPDYVVTLPITQPDAVEDNSLPTTNVSELAVEAAQETEPSASLLLLETQTADIPAAADLTEEPVIAEVETNMDEITVEDASSADEAELAADNIGLSEIDVTEQSVREELSSIAQPEAEPVDEEPFFMDTEDAEAMLEAQLQADESWMASVDTNEQLSGYEEVLVIEEASPEVWAEESDLNESEMEAATDESSVELDEPGIEESRQAIHAESGQFFSFPTSVAPAFDPFPVDLNDNGIRIDPSIPIIRIPEPAPRFEEKQAEGFEPQTEIRASFMDTTNGDLSRFATGDMLKASQEPVQEQIRAKVTHAKTMIPRQLSSPEAFELREASGTMIIIREEEEITAEDEPSVDRRQQGGPELRGSEPMETEEPKFKISAVPTAEPGYEPGYTNQQRTNRKPVTVQPENTRRWF